MSKKRTASEALSSDSLQTSKKAKATANSPPPAVNEELLTRGAKRQAKSERNKKGKKTHTREQALARNAAVKEKEAARKAARLAARLIPAEQLQGTDVLASGSDYVPLSTGDPKPHPLNIPASGTTKLPDGTILLPKKSKKGLTKADRKAKAELNRAMQKAKTARNKRKRARKQANANLDPTVSPEHPASQLDPKTSTESAKPTHRFILFIGNLPFNTTTEAIRAHFASLLPFTVRHSTDKDTGKSKGFAFLEFNAYDRMKTCINLYHHSYFNPENAGQEPLRVIEDDELKTQQRNAENGGSLGSGKDRGRRINVELTAGGGGKSKGRVEKIKMKNQKLKDERGRRVQKEKTEKIKERIEKDKKSPATGTNADGASEARGDIHPSRLSRVKG